MEMPILGLMIPKKNAAVCNGITIVLYEMEGCNMAPKFKGFLPRFPRWAVYEMMLVFPFHTGHGFFHSIQVQSRGIFLQDISVQGQRGPKRGFPTLRCDAPGGMRRCDAATLWGAGGAATMRRCQGPVTL